jgi:hypothetical protein
LNEGSIPHYRGPCSITRVHKARRYPDALFDPVPSPNLTST